MDRLRGQLQRQLGVQLDARHTPEVAHQLHGRELVADRRARGLEGLGQQILVQAALHGREVPGEAREPVAVQLDSVGSAHEAHDLESLARRDAGADQQRVGALVRTHALAEHPLEDQDRAPELLVRSAGVDEVVVHVNVPAQAMPLREVLAEVESLVHGAAAVAKLGREREREVAGPDAAPLHVVQHRHALVVEPLARAPVEQRVVCEVVRPARRAPLHLLEQLEGLVEAVLLAVALQDCAVGDDVRLDAEAGHLVEDRRHTVDLAASGAGVDERVVGHQRELELQAPHLLVHGPHAVEALLVAEALEDRAVDDRVHQGRQLRVVEQLTDELVASLGSVVRDEGLDHATNGRACRHHIARAHLAPGTPDTREVPEETMPANDAAKRVGTIHLHAVVAPLASQLLAQQVRALAPDAGFADGAEQHLVHLVLQSCHDGHGALDIRTARVWLNTLQQDRARDLVWAQAAGLHLLDDGPAVAARADLGVDELMEGHVVWHEASRAHRLDARARAPEVAALDVRLDSGVVGDHVSNACGHRLGKDALG
mmetsp:Transcript_54607/g.155418  ORF Transcript_54607/g.155418 Transcript_54607/m.155418 type:complete len:543 (-) Transcript_54607:229-1857(-)